MMTDAFLGFMCIAASLSIFYGPWQALCTDVARQVIFEQRDILFDMALRSEIEFESIEYRAIRTKMESLIRFAHELSLAKYIYLVIFFPMVRQIEDGNSMLSIAEAIGSDEVRARIQNIVVKSYGIILGMMIFKSIFVIILLPILTIICIFGIIVRSIMSWMKNLVLRYGAVVQAEADCV